MKLEGKVVVVSGAGSGIGRQLVLALIRKGAQVAAVDIHADALQETRSLASNPQGVSVHVVNVASREAVAALAGDVQAAWGGVDVLVNNAGIIHPFAPIETLDLDAMERVVQVNLYGVIYMTKAFLPLLRQRPAAHIVNVSSMGGIFPFPGQTLYGATKAGIRLFSEGLRLELAGTGVGVTVVFPGAVNTNIVENSGVSAAGVQKLGKSAAGTAPEVVARLIIDGIERNRAQVYAGMDSKLLSALYRVSPELNHRLIGAVMKRVLPRSAG